MTQQGGRYDYRQDQRNDATDQVVDKTRELAEEALERASAFERLKASNITLFDRRGGRNPRLKPLVVSNRPIVRIGRVNTSVDILPGIVPKLQQILDDYKLVPRLGARKILLPQPESLQYHFWIVIKKSAAFRKLVGELQELDWFADRRRGRHNSPEQEQKLVESDGVLRLGRQ